MSLTASHSEARSCRGEPGPWHVPGLTTQESRWPSRCVVGLTSAHRQALAYPCAMTSFSEFASSSVRVLIIVVMGFC